MGGPVIPVRQDMWNQKEAHCAHNATVRMGMSPVDKTAFLERSLSLIVQGSITWSNIARLLISQAPLQHVPPATLATLWKMTSAWMTIARNPTLRQKSVKSARMDTTSTIKEYALMMHATAQRDTWKMILTVTTHGSSNMRIVGKRLNPTQIVLS